MYNNNTAQRVLKRAVFAKPSGPDSEAIGLLEGLLGELKSRTGKVKIDGKSKLTGGHSPIDGGNLEVVQMFECTQSE